MVARASDEAWKLSGLCRQVDLELFFPEKGASAAEGKKVCGMCEVRAECLAYALEHREPYGIWGGLSEMQRRQLGCRKPAEPKPAPVKRERRSTAAPVRCNCGLPYCSGKVCRQTRSVHLRKAAELARAQVAA